MSSIISNSQRRSDYKAGISHKRRTTTETIKGGASKNGERIEYTSKGGKLKVEAEFWSYMGHGSGR